MENKSLHLKSLKKNSYTFQSKSLCENKIYIQQKRTRCSSREKQAKPESSRASQPSLIISTRRSRDRASLWVLRWHCCVWTQGDLAHFTRPWVDYQCEICVLWFVRCWCFYSTEISCPSVRSDNDVRTQMCNINLLTNIFIVKFQYKSLDFFSLTFLLSVSARVDSVTTLTQYSIELRVQM